MTAGYVYGVEGVNDYSGLFFSGSANMLSYAEGIAVAPGVRAEIVGGQNTTPSVGVYLTNYSTVQSDWIYGQANIKIYPSMYPSPSMPTGASNNSI